MEKVEDILNLLKTIKRKGIKYYCFIPTSNGLIDYLSGFSKGCLLLNKTISSDDFIAARFEAISALGWKVTSANPVREMQEKSMSDEKIIQELLDIEIETWRLLKQRVIKNSLPKNND